MKKYFEIKEKKFPWKSTVESLTRHTETLIPFIFFLTIS
jgi:hypothetical protein